MLISNVIKNLFSKDQRDRGTKWGWFTAIAAPVAAWLGPLIGDVVMAPEFNAFLASQLGPLFSSEFGWLAAIVANNLGIARAAQPAK